MPMSRLAAIRLVSALMVALAIALAAVIVYTVVDEDWSVLPGVPQSDLRRQQLEVELADPASLDVSPQFASQMASVMVYGERGILSTVPVTLRSAAYPLYDGPAWAVFFDTATVHDSPPLSIPCCPLGIVTPEHDYFIVFIDAECGAPLRILASDMGSHLPPTPTFVDPPAPYVPGEFCPWPGVSGQGGAR